MADDFKALIAKVATGASLTRTEAASAFDRMMSGEATPSQMGALLMGLRVRGETVDEITGAVTTMRAKMLGVKAPPDAIDVVGTGGDASGSFNISTCAAFIVAGAGVPVAKHGNRALSSKSGAADVLQALGVKIDLGAEQVGACIREAGIGFMFAPAHHPAMKNVGPTRVELGTRTIFNLLGPLSNPASVKRQMIGTFSKQWIEPMAQVLKNLGSECIWVVHGSDGLDEITTSGPTSVAELKDGKVRTFEVTPEQAGLKRVKPEALRGGDAGENAKALLDVLKGKAGPFRDVAILNAAAALIVAGKAKDLKAGAALAAKSIDSSEAEGRLDRLIAVSNAVEEAHDPEKWERFRRSCARKNDVRYSHQDRNLQTRGNRGGQTRAPAQPVGTRRQGGTAPARFPEGNRAQSSGRRLRADRRDQEGEPIEGLDPRRFRSAAACQGL